jgi:hypothetical protein
LSGFPRAVKIAVVLLPLAAVIDASGPAEEPEQPDALAAQAVAEG